MIVEQGGLFYIITKNERPFVVLVSVPKNHKPNTMESKVVCIFNDRSELVYDEELYEEFKEHLINEGIITLM